MTDEQLKRGEELKTQINRLRGKIDHWKKATGILEINLQFQYRDGYLEEKRNFVDGGEFVNFDVFKTLALQTMKTKLEELEKEYREL